MGDIINIALTESYMDEYRNIHKRIIKYTYDEFARTIKIKETIRPDKIMVLTRLLKRTGNGDINIIVGNPEL